MSTLARAACQNLPVPAVRLGGCRCRCGCDPSHPCGRPLAARRPTEANSCRCTTTATRFKRRPTSCLRSTSAACDPCWPQGTEAPGPADWETVCAEVRKSPPHGVSDAGPPPRISYQRPRHTPNTLVGIVKYTTAMRSASKSCAVSA
jgi:hypothetical protein